MDTWLSRATAASSSTKNIGAHQGCSKMDFLARRNADRKNVFFAYPASESEKQFFGLSRNEIDKAMVVVEAAYIIL